MSRVLPSQDSTVGDAVEMHTPQPDASTAAEPPVRRRWVWKTAAVLFLPALLVAAELILRVADFAAPPKLFVPFDLDGGAKVHRTNRDYARPFFFKTYHGRRVPHGEPVDTYLAIPKPEGVVRVVFIGASTVEGFPHNHNLAASRFLKRMLTDMVEPTVRVEVLNLGISALASFPLVRLARDSLTAEPDLAVVYAGHNEFYGAYGVASLQSAFVGRWGMKVHESVRRARLYQAFRGLLGADSDSRAPTREDLIAVMPAGILDGPADPRYAQAAANLHGSLTEIFATFRTAGVPVVACTLVCNERDMAPFASADPDPHVPPDSRAHWHDHFDTGMNLRASDGSRALAEFEMARALFDGHALLSYETARLRLAAGDVEGARTLFRAAVDADCMPWRAGARANRSVRAAAADAAVPIADVISAFEDHLDGLPVGWGLMADHLHPSVEGHALMARVIASTIAEHDLLDGISPGSVDRLRSLPAYRDELGDDPIVELATMVRTANFIADSPLHWNNHDAVNALMRQAHRLLDQLKISTQAHLRPYVGLADEGTPPMPRNIALSIAADARHDGDLETARHYFRIGALAAEPYSFERLEARTGELVARRKLGIRDDPEALRAALDEARIVLETTRRAGGDMHLALLWALLGDESRAMESVRRHADGLTDAARQGLHDEIRELLDRRPPEPQPHP